METPSGIIFTGVQNNAACKYSSFCEQFLHCNDNVEMPKHREDGRQSSCPSIMVKLNRAFV